MFARCSKARLKAVSASCKRPFCVKTLPRLPNAVIQKCILHYAKDYGYIDPKGDTTVPKRDKEGICCCVSPFQTSIFLLSGPLTIFYPYSCQKIVPHLFAIILG